MKIGDAKLPKKTLKQVKNMQQGSKPLKPDICNPFELPFPDYNRDFCEVPEYIAAIKNLIIIIYNEKNETNLNKQQVISMIILEDSLPTYKGIVFAYIHHKKFQNLAFIPKYKDVIKFIRKNWGCQAFTEIQLFGRIADIEHSFF